MKMLVVLLDSARDITTLTVTHNVVIKPLPIGQLSLLGVNLSDVFHEMEFPLVFLLTQCTLKHGTNVSPEMNLQIPENLRLEGTPRTLIA